MAFGAREIEARLVGKDVSMSTTLDRAGDASTKMGQKMKTAAKVGALGLLALGAAAIKFGADAVRTGAEAEQAQRQLTDAYKRFPALADVNIQAMRKLNEQLALKTRFDDDAYASSQAILAQYKLTGTQLQKLTPLLADYAAKTGKELPAAAKALGKAFTGSNRALKEVGVDLELTGNKTKDFRRIVGALRSQVGGFAKKEGKSFSGRAEIMRNRIDELKEWVAKRLMPILLRFMTWITDKGIPALERFAEWIGPKIRKASDYARKGIVYFQGVLKRNNITMDRARDLVDKFKKSLGLTSTESKALGKVIGGVLVFAIEDLGKALDKLLFGLGEIAEEIDILKAKAQAFADFWKSIDFSGFTAPGGVPGFNGFGSSGASLASGFSGTSAGLSSSGPVVVAGGGGVTVNVAGYVGDERKLAAELERVTRTTRARFGGV